MLTTAWSIRPPSSPLPVQPASLRTLWFERIQASPYSPQAKGKQEAFFATLRAQFLPEVDASDIATLADLNHSLLAWIECVYGPAA